MQGAHNQSAGGGPIGAALASLDQGPVLGVAIVAFRSAEVIEDCLASLRAAHGARLRIVVLDNASDDDTVARIVAWAARQAPPFTFAEAGVGAVDRALADLTLLRSARNGGYAYGVNRCLEILLADQEINLFWLLNPDAQVWADAPRAFAEAGADGGFALMGGRVVYAQQPRLVQTDGGRFSRWTGRCVSVNQGEDVRATAMPEAASLDYITGASCVASRRFIEAAGLMREDYFLFYEEVDWAQRRAALPLRVAPGAVVVHQGGTSIGSATLGRRSSAFASYFNARNRMRFLRRFAPGALPLGAAYGVAKAAQVWLVGGAGAEAWAVLAGTLGLAAPRNVRERLDPAARALAFAPMGHLEGANYPRQK